MDKGGEGELNRRWFCQLRHQQPWSSSTALQIVVHGQRCKEVIRLIADKGLQRHKVFSMVSNHQICTIYCMTRLSIEPVDIPPYKVMPQLNYSQPFQGGDGGGFFQVFLFCCLLIHFLPSSYSPLLKIFFKRLRKKGWCWFIGWK